MGCELRKKATSGCGARRSGAISITEKFRTKGTALAVP